MPTAKQRAHVEAMKQFPLRKPLRQKPPAPKESWWTTHASPTAPREKFIEAVAQRQEERLNQTAYVTPWNRKEKSDA